MMDDKELALVIRAIRPIANMGVATIEKEERLQPLNVPFYDCPDDLVLYHDNMGNSLTVGNVRLARQALQILMRMVRT